MDYYYETDSCGTSGSENDFEDDLFEYHPPVEHLSVFCFERENDHFGLEMFEDGLIEMVVYEGKKGIVGDQDRYALVPMEKTLSFSKQAIMRSKCIEFLISVPVTMEDKEGDATLVIQCHEIWMQDQDEDLPMKLYLEDNTNRYSVYSDIYLKNDEYVFENLMIKKIE